MPQYLVTFRDGKAMRVMVSNRNGTMSDAEMKIEAKKRAARARYKPQTMPDDLQATGQVTSVIGRE